MKNNSIGYITLVVLLAVTGVFSLNLFFRQRTAQDELDIRVFPYVVGEWKGKDLQISERDYEILETRNLILREYANPAEEKLFLFIIYSETNRAVFHPPEACLIGSGIRITDKKTEEISYGKENFLTNELYLEKNNHKEMALYCYKAGNLYTDSYYLQQANFAFNQLLGKHIRGATIRVSMPIREDKGVALVTLKSFIAQTAEIIDALPVPPVY